MSGNLGWVRTIAISFALVFVLVSCWTVILVHTQAKGGDFVSYWAAAKLVVAGTPALTYDYVAHRAIELSAVQIKGILTFPYPPPYLILIAPFRLLPFSLSFAAWLLFSVAIYLACTRHVAPVEYRLAHPQALVNALSGQNGFLTTALFAAGMNVIDRRPFAGGMILGLFIMKPQLALMLPVAVIAGRIWPAIPGAVLSATLAIIVALGLFGMETYEGFFAMLPFYTNAMEASRWPWNEFASVFAFARHIGLPQQQAMLVHAIVAISAAVIVWSSWRRNSERKVPILAAASLLATPYMLTYDALLLVLPMGWLLREGEERLVLIVVWLLCLLPIATYMKLYPGPNPLPIAAILCLAALSRRDALLERKPERHGVTSGSDYRVPG